MNITLNALIKRINRKLARTDEVLKKWRGPGFETHMGDYYVVDLRSNAVVRGHIDPEDLGREIGVLRAWERVAWG